MCGPSGQETQLAGQQSSLSSLLSANFSERFGAQSEVLSNLRNLYTPIAEAGPDQQGFGAQELAALNTQAGEGVGANYAKARQALGAQLSAQGGGNEFLPSGARASLESNLAQAGADQLSNEQLGITRANYATGRQNWEKATAGLQALSQQYNPEAFAGLATNANQTAFGEANKINQEKQQLTKDIVGGSVALATSFL